MAIVVPVTMLVIFLILYTMFRSSKWAMLILVSVIMASIGGPLALFITAHQLLGLLGGWLSGALRRLGARPASS